MIKKGFVFVFLVVILYSCSYDLRFNNPDLSLYAWSGLSWMSVDSDWTQTATKRLIYEEVFGAGNSIRQHQSMSVYDSIAFCFNDGDECHIFDMASKKRLASDPLPYKCHHNNAQFSHKYLDDSKYPLLILSRGDYPPNNNEFYIIQIDENDQRFSFTVHKTIHNSIKEAQYGGSWVIDDINGMLYLYCMTTGDWQKKDNNVFCVFSFLLPDITKPEDVTLGYEDVIERWEYTYLIPQGGDFFNGYLLFNVMSFDSVEGKKLPNHKNVIAVDTTDGHISFVLPLDDIKETEGISVYNDKLYVSFKEGIATQSPDNIVFSLYEYSLPTTILNN